MALLRPSELARIWELSPKTVYFWIREGKLPAIKTPGAQYRVRADDARAYCEKNGLPMPREVKAPRGSVTVIGKPSAAARALDKACKARGAAVASFASALEGLLAVAAEAPDVVAIDAKCADVKLKDALRALRRTEATSSVPVVVFDAAEPAGTLRRLGASGVALRGDADGACQLVIDALDEVRLGGGPPRGRG